LVKEGIGTDLMVNGTIINLGIIDLENSATISFLDSSRYVHKQDGGFIPLAIWGKGSTCEITGVIATMPDDVTQNFYNFTWNCPNQNTDLILGWQNGVNVGGTLTIENTNWNRLSTSTPANQLKIFDGSGSCVINNITVNGSNSVLAVQSNNYLDTVFINGSVTLSNGGLFSLSNDNNGITICYIKGDFTVIDSAYFGTCNSNNISKLIFSGSAGQNFTLPSTGSIIIGSPSIEIDSGAILNITTSEFGGTGSFKLNSNATLQTAHINGINGNIACTGVNGGGNSFSTLANYTFNGSSAQVTGSMMPAETGSLVINNGTTVTLTNSVLINETLEMMKGSLSLGGKTLRFAPLGTLKYSGTIAQSTTDDVFPLIDGPSNLTIANAKGVTLHASRMITGNLDLSGKLTLGTNTLTTSSVSNSGNTAYVVTGNSGILKINSVGQTQKIFPVGLSSSYTPIWISNYGEVDTIGVTVLADNADAPFGGRVKVKWIVNENTEGGGDYTIQFGWMVSVENTAFRSDKGLNSKIFNLLDTTEAGSGDYSTQFNTSPYTVTRGGITKLGPFAVGRFKYITGVNNQSEDIPLKFQLSQNYPNPFNPETRISYALPVASSVRLAVYDLLAREVTMLVNETKPAGKYEVTWNAKGLASGIYFYRLQAGSFIKTEKLILLK
jgi:hypothetical protein